MRTTHTHLVMGQVNRCALYILLVIGGGIQVRTETTTLYIFRSLDERHFVEAYTAAILLGSFSVMIVLIAEAVKRREEKRQSSEEALERV